MIALHKLEIEKVRNKNGDSSKSNESHIITTENSHFGDLSGSLSQDIQRLEYFKAQEQENIELKNKINIIDFKFKEIVEKFNDKIQKKNERIKKLTDQITLLQSSEQELPNLKDNKLERSLSAINMIKEVRNPDLKIYIKTDLENNEMQNTSNDDSVIY